MKAVAGLCSFGRVVGAKDEWIGFRGERKKTGDRDYCSKREQEVGWRLAGQMKSREGFLSRAITAHLHANGKDQQREKKIFVRKSAELLAQMPLIWRGKMDLVC
jgi:hypothetical protein